MATLNISAPGYSMMLKRYSAFVLLSLLLGAAASAQDGCKEVEERLSSTWQQLQSARLGSSEAATEYSTCVEDQGPEYCQEQYSKLQSAKDDLKPAVKEYEVDRGSAIESGCVEPSDDDRRPFGKIQPLGVWPPK
jgi:hypothetical protein